MMDNKENIDGLRKALGITIENGELPTTEQLEEAAYMWKDTVNRKSLRLDADKDFLAGAIWGIQLMMGTNEKYNGKQGD